MVKAGCDSGIQPIERPQSLMDPFGGRSLDLSLDLGRSVCSVKGQWPSHGKSFVAGTVLNLAAER